MITELFRLKPGVRSAVGSDGVLRLAAWPHVSSIGRLDAGQSTALRRLVDQSCTAAQLTGDSTEEGIRQLLARLWAGGWLIVTVAADDHHVFTLRPLRPPPPEPVRPGHRLELSRFAVLHRGEAAGMTVESPRAWCDIDLHHPAALAELGDLAGQRPNPGLPTEVRDRLRHDLEWAGIATPGEDEELRTRQWSTHELWFHDRSRLGTRGRRGFGATSWAKGTFPPLPVRPDPPPDGPAIDLHRPDLESLRDTDPSLTTVLEDRRSTRTHDERDPITARQLGEFLYRCARTRKTWTTDGVEHASRPYPSGGALHELELYPVLTTVTGLAAGMYHYDSHDHRLELVRPATDAAVRRLLLDGQPAQVLLVMSARIGRLMWKYEAMAYALILKHVGVVQQTMYLVATAMGLSVCAVGTGDDAAFAEATGLDPLVECSVGELILGG